MSGVSVDTSGPSQADLDMRAAFEGGGNFMSRLQQLSDLKAQHDEALAQLNLGRTAHVALADASAKQSAAAAKLADAEAALIEAGKTKAAMLAQAKAASDAYIIGAQSQVDEATAAAAKVKADADGYAAGKKKEADRALKAVAAKEAAATVKLQEAEAALASHTEAKAQADQAKADADALATALQHKLDALHVAIDKVKA